MSQQESQRFFHDMEYFWGIMQNVVDHLEDGRKNDEWALEELRRMEYEIHEYLNPFGDAKLCENTFSVNEK